MSKAHILAPAKSAKSLLCLAAHSFLILDMSRHCLLKCDPVLCLLLSLPHPFRRAGPATLHVQRLKKVSTYSSYQLVSARALSNLFK